VTFQSKLIALNKDTEFIQNNIESILNETSDQTSVSQFTNGNISKTYKVTVSNQNSYVVQQASPWVKIRALECNMSRHLKNLSGLSPKIINFFRIFEKKGDLFFIMEHVNSIRPSNLEDVQEAILEMILLSSKYPFKNISQHTPPKHISVNTLEERGLEIYEESYVMAQISSSIDMEAIYLTKKWVEYFIKDNQFKKHYYKLPLAYIHGDLKTDNLIVTKKWFENHRLGKQQSRISFKRNSSDFSSGRN